MSQSTNIIMKKLLIIIGILSLSIVYQAQYSEKEHAFSLQFNAISPFQKSIEIQAEAMLSPRFGLGFAFANSYGNHFDYDYRLKGFFRTYTWDSEQKIGLFAEIASTIPMYDRYSNYDSEPLFGVGAGVKIINMGGITTELNAGYVFADVLEFIYMAIVAIFNEEHDAYYDPIPNGFFENNRSHAYYAINIGISI